MLSIFYNILKKYLFKIDNNGFYLNLINSKDYSYKIKVNPLFDDEAILQKKVNNISNFKYYDGITEYANCSFFGYIENVIIVSPSFLILKRWNKYLKFLSFHAWSDINYRNYIFGLPKLIFQKYIPEAFYLDGNVGLNYFHFFNDILVKKFDFNTIENNSKSKCLISQDLFKTEWFQFYYNSKYFEDINFIILNKQKNYKIRKLFVSKPVQFDYSKLSIISDFTLSKILNYKNIYSTKIFIARRSRTIENIYEIIKVMDNFGYITLYLEDLPFEQQVHIFSKAKIIIGIHGAGLTNIIFSKNSNPVILEIFPINFAPSFYYWLSNAFGYKYKAIYGSPINSFGKFHLDVNILSKRLIEIESQ